MTYRRMRTVVAVVLVAAVVTVVSVIVARSDGRKHATVPGVASPALPATTSEYLPGLAADDVLPPVPARAGRAPIVVLVPGGGWHTADRTGLLPLARALAEGGAVTVTVTYRGSDQGGRFPGTVEEVTCAAGFAVRQARTAGIEPTHVVLLGHSAGGHLAALAALAPSEFRGSCPYPAARVDGLVGLAGAYEPRAFDDLADPFFGSPRDLALALWRDGDAVVRAARPEHPLRVLLLHGDADDMVPPAMTSQFALALRAGGSQVTVSTLLGADHAGAYAAGPVAPRVLDWLRAWPR